MHSLSGLSAVVDPDALFCVDLDGVHRMAGLVARQGPARGVREGKPVYGYQLVANAQPRLSGAAAVHELTNEEALSGAAGDFLDCQAEVEHRLSIRSFAEHARIAPGRDDGRVGDVESVEHLVEGFIG